MRFHGRRITGILEIEALAMYGALIAAAYFLFGGATDPRHLVSTGLSGARAAAARFSVVAAVTQPIKIGSPPGPCPCFTRSGYPIASSGVTIQIGQYQLLVAAACAGLNSIISLGAICLFYVYLRHRNTSRPSWSLRFR